MGHRVPRAAHVHAALRRGRASASGTVIIAYSMNNLRDSLGGQNNRGRPSGARSSRALSSIFKQLQSLDREITELDKQKYVWWSERIAARQSKLRGKLDAKRKLLRAKRKQYFRQ